MKYYIDTSLAIALANEKDPNHEMAIKIYSKDGKKVVSKLVLAELYSVYSRRMKVSDAELEALVNYTLNKCKCEIEEVDFDKVIDFAVKISNKVKLKTLDLLHLSISIILESEILSLDEEIIKAKNKLR
jgi:predicted nucleic acid-binding protein